MIEHLHDGHWLDRRVLVTGHTGFKGAWLVRVLRAAGAHVSGLALRQPDTRGAVWALAPDLAVDQEVDLLDPLGVERRVRQTAPDTIIHLAAQSLVREGYQHPSETFAVNVQGTAHLLDAATRLDCRPTVVVATTDKVYRNHGLGRAFREGDELGGHDPYSASKAAVELLVASWPDQTGFVTARSGNVIGGGDRGVDRLVPDAIRSLEARVPLEVRNPDSTRPWQHVLEPLFGYLEFARTVSSGSPHPSAVNFGPDPSSTTTVSDVLERLSAAVGGLTWVHRPDPLWREAEVLTLDATLAERALGWRPQLSLDEAVEWTCEWYSTELAGGDLAKIADRQIAEYMARSARRSPR